MKSVILYTTRYGSAVEAAKCLRGEMAGDCILVDLMTKKAPPLDSFDAVVLGGSIYVGKVQKQLTEYMRSHLSELLSKKLGIYLCAGSPEPEDREKELRSAFPAPLFSHASAKGILGYAYNFEKMRFLDKLIMKRIKGDTVSVAEYNKEEIQRFAKLLAE